MSILKFAQFATIEAKVAPARITRTAMLRDARRHEFSYTPKPGFLYVRSRAISSRTNDNFDTYPADELRKSYRTFVGKPVFVNHNNDDPRRGRGIILDAVLHEHTAPDGSPDTWVEVLMEVDAVRFPRLAQAILDGDIDRTSMGCNVMSSECSYCGKVASTPDQYCEHINNQKGRRLRRRAATGGVESVLVHEVCRGLSFFENSLLVDEPADPTAFFTGVDDSGMRMGRVAAFKIAADDDLDELLRVAREANEEWTRQQLKANRNSKAYKDAHRRARETSKALLDAKLRRNKQGTKVAKRSTFVWSAYYDHWGGESTPSHVSMDGPDFETGPEAAEFAAQFPKSWGIQGGRTYSSEGEWGYVSTKNIVLMSNAANKGINETGLKRLRTVLAGLAARGFSPVYTPNAGNAYPTEAAFWAAIENYEAAGRTAKVAAFKLAYDDLAGLTGKVIQYRKVGTFRVLGPVQDGEDRWGGHTTESGGWYWCEPIKAPKKYRDEAAAAGGRLRLYVMNRDVIDKEASVAKTALGSEWDHGPLEPGPEAATRWEGVATSGQGYQVVVLWREYADSMAAMLSGVFATPERAEEWAQKCRDLGAIDVDIRPPLMERGEEFLEQHRWQGSKTAMPDEQGMTPEEIDSMWNANFWRGQAEQARQVEEGRKRLWAWKGQEVTVVKGRKIPKGTTGIVFYSGEGQWGWRIGFRTADGQELWTNLSNVELTSELSSTAKKADYDEVHRAHPIETLRNQTCPVCKTQNTWDGNICTVCGYVLPPKPFRAPDTDVTGRVDPDEGWFDPDAKKADPFDPVPDRDTAMKGQKDQGDLTMAQSIAAAARQRLQAQQLLAQQRRAGMSPRRAADDGTGTVTDDVVPPAEAPAVTTEEAIALPDAQAVEPTTPGGTGVEGTEPDATVDVSDVGGVVPDSPPLDVINVEAPVAGATDVDPEADSDERPNINNAAENADGTPLNAADWNTAARRSARSEMENIRTAVRDRIFSALRLSKLRIAVGVAEHGDELALAREIEDGRLSNESIANEIKALGLVYSRQRQAQTMPTAPHRRSARRSPSMAGGSTPLQSLGSGGSQDDEALFEP